MPALSLKLPDPGFLLALYDENTREGRSRLHPWQKEVHLRYAREDLDFSKQVNQINVVASNGSGKSSKVAAPCAVWTAMRYQQSRTVITSSSGVQLDRQIGRAVNQLCLKVNAVHKRPHWDLKYREYKYYPDPEDDSVFSIIEMYATDEPGKAEGYHPLIDGGIFAMITDEGKTINEEIWTSIFRCNGKTHWMNVSSSGAPQGSFYNFVTAPRWWTKIITCYDCPHIKEDEIEDAKEMYGEHSTIFRSMYLSEFTSANENVVIPYERILRQYREPYAFLDDGIRRAGVDLSGGGDENVVSVWEGNRQIGLEIFRITDLRQSVPFLVNIFRKYGLRGEHINVDDGYVGRAIIDYLKNEKYEVNSVRFGSTAFNAIAYANRGTELWFNFERHLPYLSFKEDSTQKKQLSSRYYKQSDRNAKIILESKKEAKANGHSSPDRADATVLAFAKVPLGYFSSGIFEQRLTPPDESVELFRKLIACKGNMQLTAEELSMVTEHYRQIKQARAPREDSEHSRYSVNRMATSGRHSVSLLHQLLRRN